MEGHTEIYFVRTPVFIDPDDNIVALKMLVVARYAGGSGPSRETRVISRVLREGGLADLVFERWKKN